MAANTNK